MTEHVKFLFNTEWMVNIRKIKDKEKQLNLFLAIMDYAETGEHSELPFECDLVIEPIKSEIGRYVAKYKEKCRKNQETATNREQKKREEAEELERLRDEHKRAQSCTDVNKRTQTSPPNPNPNPEPEPEPNPDVSNETVKKNNKKEFTPPTIDEVRAYMQEYIKEKAEKETRYLTIGDDDPELFIAHHSAGGWVLKNRQVMKDWRQAVRTWILNHNKWTPDHLEERKHTLLQDDTDFGRFNRWLLREVPYVAGHFDTLLNEHQFTALKRAYGTERLTDILYDLENRHDWCDKCSDLNTTLINWLNKDNGKQ